MGLDAMILIFWMLSFKPAFLLSSFTFIKRLFNSSSLSAVRVVSSAYLRLLIFLLAILILAYAIDQHQRVWIPTPTQRRGKKQWDRKKHLGKIKQKNFSDSVRHKFTDSRSSANLSKSEVKWSEVKVAQSRPTVCNPMDYIYIHSVHGILQARILEWAAFLFSRGSSQPRGQTQVSRITGRFFTIWATQ